jgi:phage tail sheath gpL-like
MGVLFNFIPGSGLVAPGTFFERNSAGQYASTSWALVLGHKSAAGSLASNAPVICTTPQEAAQLAGVGSSLYEAFRSLRRAAPAAIIHVCHVPTSGSAAAWTVTIGTLASAGGLATLEIAGRYVRIAVAAGESASTTATNLAAAINAWVDPLTLAYLPVTATVASNVVTLTHRHAGTIGNDCEVFADDAIPGNLFTASTVTISQTVTAAGVADVTAALAALGDNPYHWIVSPFGEAANLTAAKAALSDVSGRWAWNQQLYGHYVTITTNNISGLTSYGLAQNDDHLTAIGRLASPTPGYEWLGAIFGRVLGWLADATNGNAARNQSNLVAESVRPPRDRANWLSAYGTRNALLQNGVSTWKVNTAGDVVIDKLITMRRQNAAGQPDTTFRDIQAMAICLHSLNYLRAALSYLHSNKAVADANPGNLATISTPADIKADMVRLYGDLVNFGLMENVSAFAASLVVERDAANRSRVNIGAYNMDQVNPLDILAVNATFRA